MYCPECGTAINEGQKFCPECGTPIQKRKQIQNAQVPFTQPDVDNRFISYLDKYIRNATTFTSAASLIEGARPLRFKWTIIGTVCALGLLFANVSGLILAFLLSLIAFRIILPLVSIKRNRKTYLTNGHTVDLDQLSVFLEDNLSHLPFTAWQRGYAAGPFGSSIGDWLVVVCLFQNKTYHRILFDKKKTGVYRIETVTATGKERLKDGGDHNPSLLYKSDCITRPILEAATKYYFRYVADSQGDDSDVLCEVPD